MITLTEKDIEVLTDAASELSRAGDKILSSEIVALLLRAEEEKKRVSYNQGCNAARYPYN